MYTRCNMLSRIFRLTAGILSLLILFILLIICVTELDKVNIEKEAEYQKLEYFRTLNKIYGGLENENN